MPVSKGLVRVSKDGENNDPAKWKVMRGFSRPQDQGLKFSGIFPGCAVGHCDGSVIETQYTPKVGCTGVFLLGNYPQCCLMDILVCQGQ